MFTTTKVEQVDGKSVQKEWKIIRKQREFDFLTYDEVP
jgi:hypothetical protein